MMITLTIDPKLFESPESAYWYVREKRAIALLVKALHQGGYLNSRRFFYVVEWHENGWPHFHLLLDASYVPFATLAQLWGRNRPKSAAPWLGSYAGDLSGQSPEFGTVRISKRKGDFESPQHACNYALKYLLKPPRSGFPKWVLESDRYIRIYATSRGLLGGNRASRESRAAAPRVQETHSADCFCDSCSSGETAGADPEERTTIRQRVSACGTQAALLRRTDHVDAAGVVVVSRREFLRRFTVPYRDVLELLGCPELKDRSIQLRPGDLVKLAGHFAPMPSVVGGGVNPGDVAREVAFDEWNEREAAKACMEVELPPLAAFETADGGWWDEFQTWADERRALVVVDDF